MTTLPGRSADAEEATMTDERVGAVEDREESVLRQFVSNTRDHRITVLRDEGLYRHVRFARRGSFYYFDLITWPGYLTICGDCETYTFRRLPDMFEFFRPERDSINPYYWGEKIQCPGDRDALKEYSEDLFREAVKDQVDDWCADNEDDADELREEVRWQILDADEISWNRDHALGLLWRFSHKGYQFEEYSDWDVQEWKHSYLWACWAIVHGIAWYDFAKGWR